MCLYLYIQNKYTQYTHIYYVNKYFFFFANPKTRVLGLAKLKCYKKKTYLIVL